MRKKRNRKTITPRAPMLSLRNVMLDMYLAEQACLMAFEMEWATPEHYDGLVECLDMLRFGAMDMGEESVIIVCSDAHTALQGIRDHHTATGKFDVDQTSRVALKALVNTSEDFWKRQSGACFVRSYERLQTLRRSQK